MIEVVDSRRRPSTKWNRLKSIPVDPLEDLGLPSKGDKRLLDFKTQEVYYNKIVERYIQWWATTGRGDSIHEALISLVLNDADTNDHIPFVPTSTEKVQFIQEFQNDHELSIVLLAMRKIREAIVASSRFDMFAQRAYVFIIRVAILTMHIESYHPALTYLLQKLHPCSPMTASEEHEFVGYYILDLACRQGDLAAAYEARKRYQYKDPTVAVLLPALAHDNWYIFWEIRSRTDGYQKRLMELGDDRMRRNALNCLGRSYLSAEKAYIEKATGRSWEQLKKQDNVGWELNEDIVTIRRIKRT